MYEKEVKKSSAQLFLTRGKDIYIPILKLKKTKNASSVLFEYLKDYGFNAEQIEDIKFPALNDFLSNKFGNYNVSTSSENNPLECKYCNRTWISKNALASHMKGCVKKAAINAAKT